MAYDRLTDQHEAAANAGFLFVEKDEIERNYPLPSAYAAYAKYLDIAQGADVFKEQEKRG